MMLAFLFVEILVFENIEHCFNCFNKVKLALKTSEKHNFVIFHNTPRF